MLLFTEAYTPVLQRRVYSLCPFVGLVVLSNTAFAQALRLALLGMRRARRHSGTNHTDSTDRSPAPIRTHQAQVAPPPQPSYATDTFS